MTARHCVPARHRLRVVANSIPQKTEGAGKAGCSTHPQPHAQIKKHMSSSPQARRSGSGFPCAVVLTVSFVLSPVIGLCCHRFRHDAEASMPEMPASRHQDHTTSPSASMRFVLAHRERPSHPAPNVRDDRDTPLLVGCGLGLASRDDLPVGESDKFLRAGLDSRLSVDRICEIGVLVKSSWPGDFSCPGRGAA